MGRRNPFDDDGRRGTEDRRETRSEPAAHLPPPPSTANRDRGWEKEKRSDGYCQVGYRHVPVEVRDRVREIAGGLYVSADEVGRLFLEFALDAYARGEIVIAPVLEAGKLTLFPAKLDAKAQRRKGL